MYAFLLFCWITACFITLLSYTQIFFQIAELSLIQTQFSGMSYHIRLLRISDFQYIAELYQILTHCLGKPKFITLLR